jgi:hypothetical protein
MPRTNRLEPAEQLDLFHPPDPVTDWCRLPTEVREAAARLLARMLRERGTGNQTGPAAGGPGDE